MIVNIIEGKEKITMDTITIKMNRTNHYRVKDIVCEYIEISTNDKLIGVFKPMNTQLITNVKKYEVVEKFNHVYCCIEI